MELKFTKFFQKPAIRSTLCTRCGHRMFQTKRFNWVCGPGCDVAQQWHQSQKKSDSNGKLGFDGNMVMESQIV